MYVLPFSKYKEKWMLPFLPEILLQVLQDDKTEPSIYSKEWHYVLPKEWSYNGNRLTIDTIIYYRSVIYRLLALLNHIM
jgi:hypothetical protein